MKERRGSKVIPRLHIDKSEVKVRDDKLVNQYMEGSGIS